MDERGSLVTFSLFKSSLQLSSQNWFHFSLRNTSIYHSSNNPLQEEELRFTMLSSLIFTSLLPLFASTNPLPLESRQSTLNPFTLIAGRSGSPIHLSSINANGESFWIGKNTASYCPLEEVVDCPAGIYTELLAGDGGASMASLPLYTHIHTYIHTYYISNCKNNSNATNHSTPKYPAVKPSTSSRPAPSPSPSPTPKANPKQTTAPQPDSPSRPARTTHSASSASRG